MSEAQNHLSHKQEHPLERLDDLASILAVGVLRLRARRIMSATSQKLPHSPEKDLISTPERSVHCDRDYA